MDEKILKQLNSDRSLLILLSMLENAKKKQKRFTLDQFSLQAYWQTKIEGYRTQAYTYANEIVNTIKDLELGKVERVSVNYLERLTWTVAESAIYASDISSEKADELKMAFDIVCRLRERKVTQPEQCGEEHDSTGCHRVYLSLAPVDWYMLEYINESFLEFIELEIKFDNKVTRNLDLIIDDYIDRFSKDRFLDNVPPDRKKRLPFKVQLELFLKYIEDLSFTKNKTYLSTSLAADEDDFEVVKMLLYLEWLGKIKVKSWVENGGWELEFAELPLKIDDVLPKEKRQLPSLTTLRDLHFDTSTAVFRFGDHSVEIGKNAIAQNELLEFFCKQKNLKEEVDYWDIGDSFSYSEKESSSRYRNAAYQVQKKIQLKTGIEDLFLTTRQTIQINPKYFKLA